MAPQIGHGVPRMSASDVDFLLRLDPELHPITFARGEVIFSQGSPGRSLLYTTAGRVKLSVVSPSGREAITAVIGPGDFFGEGCLSGRPVRTSSATAITPAAILSIDGSLMIHLLHTEQALADLFIEHMLTRNSRLEDDLVDQIFNTSEKRLARTLLLLAQSPGHTGAASGIVPRISHETLAQIVGTTRPRVSYFLSRFRRLGHVEYHREGPITVNRTLVAMLLQE